MLGETVIKTVFPRFNRRKIATSSLHEFQFWTKVKKTLKKTSCVFICDEYVFLKTLPPNGQKLPQK